MAPHCTPTTDLDEFYSKSLFKGRGRAVISRAGGCVATRISVSATLWSAPNAQNAADNYKRIAIAANPSLDVAPMLENNTHPMWLLADAAACFDARVFCGLCARMRVEDPYTAVRWDIDWI